MRSHGEIGFVDVTRGGSGALQQVIGSECLRRSGKPKLLLRPIADGPAIRRFLKCAGIGGDKLGGNSSRKPVETQEPAVPVLIVRSPTGVSDYPGLVIDHLL